MGAKCFWFVGKKEEDEVCFHQFGEPNCTAAPDNVRRARDNQKCLIWSIPLLQCSKTSAFKGRILILFFPSSHPVVKTIVLAMVNLKKAAKIALVTSTVLGASLSMKVMMALVAVVVVKSKCLGSVCRWKVQS